LFGGAVEPQSSDVPKGLSLLEISAMFTEIRDNLIAISLGLADLLIEIPSAERDKAIADVTFYLRRIAENGADTS
jgi:hypothetical protein